MPDDELLFSPEFDERIRERFPLGSSEDKLIDVLTKEHFVQNGLICEKIVRVFWQADATGVSEKFGVHTRATAHNGVFSICAVARIS